MGKLDKALDTILDVVEQTSDLVQANGADATKEERDSLKAYVDIYDTMSQTNLKEEDAKVRRIFEHEENLRKIEIDERKLILEEKRLDLEEMKEKNSVIKTGIVGAVFIVCTGMTVFQDWSGSAMSKPGQALANLFGRVVSNSI